VPTIADNLGAILQNWAQIKMAKEMNAMQNPILPDSGVFDFEQNVES